MSGDGRWTCCCCCVGVSCRHISKRMGWRRCAPSELSSGPRELEDPSNVCAKRLQQNAICGKSADCGRSPGQLRRACRTCRPRGLAARSSASRSGVAVSPRRKATDTLAPHVSNKIPGERLQGGGLGAWRRHCPRMSRPKRAPLRKACGRVLCVVEVTLNRKDHMWREKVGRRASSRYVRYLFTCLGLESHTNNICLILFYVA